MIPRIKKYAPLPVLAVVSLLIYSNILHAPFLFDDAKYIVDNPAIRDLTNFLYPTGTRYVAFLSFALNYAASGYETYGYHITNVVIHILNAFFVYLLVLTLFRTPLMKGTGDGLFGWKEGLLAALIFLAHPVQTQAVSYITQRFTTLATFFYLASVLLYLKARLAGLEEESGGDGKLRPWHLYLGALFSGLLAQMTKETGFTLPAMIVLTEFTFFEAEAKNARRLVRLVPFFLLFAVIPISLFAPRAGALKGSGIAENLRAFQLEELATLSRYEYFVTELRVVVTYLRLLVCPVNQNLDYDYPVYNSFFEAPVVLSFIFLSAILISAVYLLLRSRRKVRSPHLLLVSFGAIWFFVALSIESSIIPIKDVIFEHRVYLPASGAVLVFTGLFFFVLDKIEKRWTRVSVNPAAWLVALIVVAALLGAARERNTVWKDNLSLWTDIVKKSPDKARGYNGLGNSLLNSGDLKGAATNFMEAIRLKEDYEKAYNNLGVVLLELGRPETALKNFKKAVALKGNYAEALNNSGIALVRMGRFHEGMAYSERALALKPESALAYNNLGIASAELGRIDEAIEHFRKSVALDPDYADARANLAFALKKAGRSN